MFGKIVYMNNNVAHIKLTSGMDAASNLMNMHVVFEDQSGKFVAEVEDVSEDLIKVIFLGEFVDGKFVGGIIRKPPLTSSLRLINDSELDLILSASDNGFQIGTSPLYNNHPITVGINALFGQHMAVFGNTGSGKTCTVVSLIQQYIHSNPDSDIKFIILDVNGEYKAAFDKKEMDFIEFEKLRFHHSMLSNSEYGRLFRAAEGVQYPAIKSCISALAAKNKQWDMRKLPNQIEEWINENTPQNQKGEKDVFSKNNISGHLRTMSLRIDSVLNDSQLMSVINTAGDEQTIDTILKSPKPVVVIDLQVSSDTLDVVLYLMFKALYERKSKRVDTTHICLVLEEAHRYINTGAEESKLGSYYIDKLAREGRKFGVGLIISSQVPSLLSYEIVSQCNSVVMHKINSKKDLEFLKNVLRVSSDNFHQQMSALEKQYAIVCGEAFPNDTVVKIHDASPRPASSDPVIEDRFLPNTPSDEDELPF